MAGSNRIFGLTPSRNPLNEGTMADRLSASAGGKSSPAASPQFPIASDWLSEEQIAEVRKAVGPVRLQIKSSVLSKVR